MEETIRLDGLDGYLICHYEDDAVSQEHQCDKPVAKATVE